MSKITPGGKSKYLIPYSTYLRKDQIILLDLANSWTGRPKSTMIQSALDNYLKRFAVIPGKRAIGRELEEGIFGIEGYCVFDDNNIEYYGWLDGEEAYVVRAYTSLGKLLSGRPERNARVAWDWYMGRFANKEWTGENIEVFEQYLNKE